MKRFSDIVLSTLGIFIFSPVFLFISILIKLDDGGPVLFRQPRLGQYKRPFPIYKFRTMTDGRVTRIGCWLRATDLMRFRNFLIYCLVL